MQTAEIIPFDFEELSVRTVLDDQGNPWFIAKDVCGVLGIGNPSQALSGLDKDEAGITISDISGQNRELLTVNESGLYALIFRSRKPIAKRFRKWVTAEVLPALRKKRGVEK